MSRKIHPNPDALAYTKPMPRQWITEQPKPEHLDRDRTIPLTEAVVSGFAARVQTVLNGPAAAKYLGPEQKRIFASIITSESTYPLKAEVVGNDILITSALADCPGAKLKDLSEGVTDCYKRLVSELREQGKMPEREQGFMMDITNWFQAPLFDAYGEAGMSVGPHTKYVTRG